MMPRIAEKSSFMLIPALVLLAVFAYLPAECTYAVSGDGLIAYPTIADPANQLSQTWFLYDLPAGESKRDSLTIKNDSDTAAAVSLYAVDSTTNNMGEFALEEEKDSRDRIGKWIVLEENRLTLQPREEKQVGFTISIPEDAPAGESSGGIIIQKDLSEAQKNTTSGFVISTRIGIRVYETVPGNLFRKADFRDASVNYNQADGIYEYIVTVKNEGNVSLDSTVRLSLRDMLFRRQDRELEQKALIPRGEEQKIVFEIDDDIFGNFEAVPALEYASAEGKQETVSAPAPTSFFAYPHGLTAALGILLGLNLLGLLAFRLRKAREKRYYADYCLQDGDNLESLSARFGVSWKTLIKLNGLKPPYQLRKGQTIRVIDKKRLLAADIAKDARNLGYAGENDRRNRQEAFDKDLALISDERPFLPPQEQPPAKKISGKITLFFLLAGSAYFLCTQVILRANDAHFVYDRGMTGGTEEENATVPPVAPTEKTSETAVTISSPAADTSDEEATDAQRKAVVIEILNGSGIKGASGKAAGLFIARGYVSVSTGNADRFDYAATTISCGENVAPAVCQEARELLAEDYPQMQLGQAGSPAADKVTIILGR